MRSRATSNSYQFMQSRTRHPIVHPKFTNSNFSSSTSLSSNNSNFERIFMKQQSATLASVYERPRIISPRKGPTLTRRDVPYIRKYESNVNLNNLAKNQSHYFSKSQPSLHQINARYPGNREKKHLMHSKSMKDYLGQSRNFYTRIFQNDMIVIMSRIYRYKLTTQFFIRLFTVVFVV